MSDTTFLELDSKRIAYALSEGDTPTVIFCGGFKSDMTGGKASALEAHCQAQGRRFVRFDYTGHGQSSGLFTDGSISQWLADAQDVIAQLGGQQILLVGSSMGAWIALLAARMLASRLVGFVGIASAPDFTENLIWNALPPDRQEQLMEEGVVQIPSCYGQEAYTITRRLVEDGREHIVLGAPIELNVPVRLLHGTHDEDVPWQTSVALLKRIVSSDKKLKLIEGGNHRLSEPEQLALMCAAVDDIFSLPAK